MSSPRSVNAGAREAAWHHDGQPGPQAHFLKLDSSKARQRLSWRPRWSFEQAIEATVAWYKAQDQKADLIDVTRSQIQRYFDAD